MATISSFISSGDIDGLATLCEEIELLAPNAVTTAEVYGTLLAVYLLQNELDHAKLLWKRIPGAVKSSNPEIPALWEVGKKLWQREFQEVYPIISGQQWPPNIQSLLHQLQDKVRNRVISLIASAYSNIALEHVSNLLGMEQDKTLSILKQQDWTVNDKTVYPKPQPVTLLQHNDSSPDKLAQLVDIVSFLEN